MTVILSLFGFEHWLLYLCLSIYALVVVEISIWETLFRDGSTSGSQHNKVVQYNKACSCVLSLDWNISNLTIKKNSHHLTVASATQCPQLPFEKVSASPCVYHHSVVTVLLCSVSLGILYFSKGTIFLFSLDRRYTLQRYTGYTYLLS